MKKKLLCIALCLVMVAAAVCALVACEDDAIVVWVGEGTKEFTEQKLKEWNETNEYDVKFNFKVEMVSESKAAGDAIQKQQSAADIFCFAQDQLARLVESGLLAPLNATSQQAVTDSCDDGSIAAATINGTIRAFPMTADNGYLMYYDKRVITDETHLTSLESLIADCEAAGRKFSMLLTTNAAWYASSFFYATGCQSEWVTNDNGTFSNFNDTIQGENGIKALQGMQKLLKSRAHQNSDKASDFDAGIGSAVVISGVWDYNTAKNALQDNLGVASLPSFKLDGDDTPYQLKSFIGYKLMGISPQTDGTKSLYLQILAQYLTSAACQQQRFEQLGWGPSDKSLSSLSNEALTKLKVTATIKQGQYPSDWWKAVDAMALSAKTSGSDAGSLTAILDTYRGKLSSFLAA